MLLVARFDLILLYTNTKCQWETPTVDFIALEFDITMFFKTQEKNAYHQMNALPFSLPFQ